MAAVQQIFLLAFLIGAAVSLETSDKRIDGLNKPDSIASEVEGEVKRGRAPPLPHGVFYPMYRFGKRQPQEPSNKLFYAFGRKRQKPENDLFYARWFGKRSQPMEKSDDEKRNPAPLNGKFFGTAFGKKSATPQHGEFFGTAFGKRLANPQHGQFFGAGFGGKRNIPQHGKFFGAHFGGKRETPQHGQYFGAHFGKRRLVPNHGEFFAANFGKRSGMPMNGEFFGTSFGKRSNSVDTITN